MDFGAPTRDSGASFYFPLFVKKTKVHNLVNHKAVYFLKGNKNHCHSKYMVSVSPSSSVIAT